MKVLQMTREIEIGPFSSEAWVLEQPEYQAWCCTRADSTRGDVGITISYTTISYLSVDYG